MLVRTLIFFLLFSCSLKADQNDARLEDLFKILSKTESDVQINEVTSSIWDIWHETNDPKINADFFRGIGLMHNGNLKESIKYFSKVIEKNPNFAEAWNKRATVLYMVGEFQKSQNDIDKVLELEQRHFGALAGQGLVNIQLQNYEKAIKSYQMAEVIYPAMKSPKLMIKQIEELIKKQSI